MTNFIFPLSIPSSSSSLKPFILSNRNSRIEGLLRRLVTQPLRPTLLSQSPPVSTPSKPVVVEEGNGAITLEFQRLKARELQEYFKPKKLDESNQGPFFGFISNNELSNGRRRCWKTKERPVNVIAFLLNRILQHVKSIPENPKPKHQTFLRLQ